ncbi:hypothetical protein ACFYWO_00035 [Streptomyces sp. NPDC002932]|uniref:hypothetical protein n=1 Tax=Streptomyces sp. NPDC002932 TaxID=3364672 RepID=UPI003699911E
MSRLPGRFIGFLPVPLGLGQRETSEIVEREVVGRGLRGIGELTPPPGGAGLIEPVLARALVERVTGPDGVRDRVLGGTIAELVGLG